MATKTLTVTFEAATFEWLAERARAAGTSPEDLVATIVRDEQAQGAMEAMAAWARDDEGAPTVEEIDRARAQMLGEVEPESA